MLSEKIKQLRTACNITQVDLAKDLKVSKQCVSNWENNNIQPSVDMLLKIAGYFSVSTDFLLGLEDRKTIDVTYLTEAQISHISQIIKDFADLNNKIQ